MTRAPRRVVDRLDYSHRGSRWRDPVTCSTWRWNEVDMFWEKEIAAGLFMTDGLPYVNGHGGERQFVEVLDD